MIEAMRRLYQAVAERDPDKTGMACVEHAQQFLNNIKKQVFSDVGATFDLQVRPLRKV